ncbi:hypothetical protein T09_8520 [Trichinella sp. T9]|nr:hypothetical protein T09_8520 [Trichinella sp. T9]
MSSYVSPSVAIFNVAGNVNWSPFRDMTNKNRINSLALSNQFFLVEKSLRHHKQSTDSWKV